MVTKHESGTISAYRYAPNCGEDIPYTTFQNRERSAILKSKLLRKGYGITKIGGVYEDSFLVIDLENNGNLRQDLKVLGEEFEQDSITFSKPNGEYYLIGTNKCEFSYPGYKIVKRLGSPMFGKDGEFHSKVSGRPFVFGKVKSELSTIGDYSISEIRTLCYLERKEICYS